MECCHWRLPNPALRDGMATPVGATGSKVRFARNPDAILYRPRVVHKCFCRLPFSDSFTPAAIRAELEKGTKQGPPLHLRKEGNHLIHTGRRPGKIWHSTQRCDWHTTGKEKHDENGRYDSGVWPSKAGWGFGSGSVIAFLLGFLDHFEVRHHGHVFVCRSKTPTTNCSVWSGTRVGATRPPRSVPEEWRPQHRFPRALSSNPEHFRLQELQLALRCTRRVKQGRTNCTLQHATTINEITHQHDLPDSRKRK